MEKVAVEFAEVLLVCHTVFGWREVVERKDREGRERR